MLARIPVNHVSQEREKKFEFPVNRCLSKRYFFDGVYGIYQHFGH